MRARENPPDTAPPDNLDYEMWTGPAPMRPYNELVHPRGWRAFMEYGNGIVGDMCIHMLDMVRWMLDLGWPDARQLDRRHPGATRTARRTSPTRRRPPSTSATCRSSGRTAPGATAPDPKYPWGATIYGDKGTLKASVMSYDFIPQRRGHADPRGRDLRVRAVPRGQDGEGPGAARRPGDPRPHEGPAGRASTARGKPVADIEQGHISTASCILANLSMKLGRSLTWDAAAGRVAGDDEANRLLRARIARRGCIRAGVGVAHTP